MARSSSEAWSRLFDPRSAITFVIGSVALAVAANAVYAILLAWLELWAFKPLAGNTVIFVFSAAVLIAAVLLLRWWFFRPAFEPSELVRPKRRKGLILLISSKEIAEKAMRYHGEALKYCWLICSETTTPLAKDLRASFPLACHVELEEVANEELLSPIKTYQKVQAIHAALPEELQHEDVISDFTGMNKPASVGMALACAGNSWPMQYIPFAIDKAGKPIGEPLDPHEIVLRPRFVSPSSVKEIALPMGDGKA